MDDLTALRDFRAERVKQNPTARAAARRALEARFEPTGEACARTAAVRRRRSPLVRHRRLLAFAGAGAAAAVVAGILLIGSGSSPETAAAEVLRRAAVVAEAGDSGAVAPPARGQFLYTKTMVVQLEGWLPEGHGAGPKASPRYFVPTFDPAARYALVPTLKEVWTARDGATRERETLGAVEFFSDADQRRWEGAGSPPPFAYDPTEHEVRRDGAGRLVKEFESRSWRGSQEFTFARKLAKLPTQPEALRLVLEHRPASGGSQAADPSTAGSARGRSTIETLMNILSEPITTPALRAAAFNALAEIPGIGFEANVIDAAGRRGDAIFWIVERGAGRRFIFDPRTSKILAQAEMLFEAKAAGYPDVPDDVAFREIAYLQAGIVGSTHERPRQWR
jgi:hypothetical protein